MTKDEFDPDVIEACRGLFDAYFDDTCDRFGKAAQDILARSKVQDVASAARLCEQIGLEIAWSDDGSLLLVTPSGKPAFLQGEPMASSDVPNVVEPKEWNRQIPFAE